MTTVLPPLFSGHGNFDGCWRPAHWDMPERLLSAWRAGSQLWRTEAPDGWLLAWPGPQHVAASDLPGWAVQRRDRLWISAALSSSHCAGHDAGLLLVWGGGLRHCTLVSADPAEWVDWGAVTVWTEALPLPATVPAAPPAPPGQARALFPEVPAESADRARTLRELIEGRQVAEPWWQRVLRWTVGARLSASAGAAAGAGWGSTSPATARGTTSAPGWWDRLLGRLQRWSGLAGMVQQQHRRYLRAVLDALEQRDWERVLRHALPLDQSPGGGEPGSLMRLLSPRADLRYSAGSGSNAVTLAQDFFQQMQQQYRRVFQALDQAGQVDEAAYVLAELLRATDEAIAYLGKHGKHRTAAELATLRELPPARQLGLWLRAGERERALGIALRHQAFQAAVQLFASDPVLQAQLRLLWGQHLLARGLKAEAVDAMWPEPALRERLTELLVAVETRGTAADARLLARAVQWLPQRFQTQWPAFERLRSDPADTGRALLKHFAHALATAPATTATRLFARECLRTLWLDAEVATAEPKLLDALLRHADDPFLNADHAGLPPVGPSSETAWMPLHLPVDSPRGSLEIHALAAVADGQVLVGLGEDGCLLVDGEGRIRRRWTTPASFFVGEPGGQLWVACQRRQRPLCCIEVLRLEGGRHEPLLWKVFACAPHLVDGLWAIAPDSGDRIQLLDMASVPPTCVWDSGPLPSPVRHLDFGTGGLAALLGGRLEPTQLWHWRYPGLALSGRDTLPAESGARAASPEPSGTALALDCGPDGSSLLRLRPGRAQQVLLPTTATAGTDRRDALPGGCTELMAIGGGLFLTWGERGLTSTPSCAVLDPARPSVLLHWPGEPLVGVDQAAADARWLWLARDGALARVDRQSGGLRWLLPG